MEPRLPSMAGYFPANSIKERRSVPQSRIKTERQNATVAGHDEDQHIADFEQELAELGLEEQWQAKQKRIASL